MNLNQFSFDDHPLIQALRLRNDLRTPLSPSGESIQGIFEYSAISHEELMEIFTKLDSKPIHQLLQEHNITYNITNDQIQNFNILIKANQINETIKYIYTLNICVDYICECEIKSNNLRLENVLSWLIDIFGPEEHKKNVEYMFYYVLWTAVKTENIEKFSDYFELISNFFEKLKKPRTTIINILIDWIKYIQTENSSIKNEIFVEMLVFIQKLINEYKSLQDPEILLIITVPITPYLLNLEPLSLLFLKKIAPCFEETYLVPLMEFIFKGIIKYSHDHGDFLEYDFSKVPTDVAELKINEEIVNFQPTEEAFAGIFERPLISIEKPINIASIFPKSYCNSLKLIKDILEMIQECGISIIMRNLKDVFDLVESPQYLAMLSSIIYVIYNLQESSLQAVNHFVIPSPVFNPAVAIYNQQPDNKTVANILAMRTIIFQLFIKTPTAIIDLFEKNMKYPLLFAELTARLKEYASEIPENILTNGKLIHAFSTSMRISIYSAFKDIDRSMCEKNVQIMYLFVKDLEKLKNPNIIKTWLTNEEFMFNFMDYSNCHFRRLFIFNIFRMKWDFINDPAFISQELLLLQSIFANHYANLNTMDQEILLFDYLSFFQLAMSDTKQTIKSLTKHIEIFSSYLPKLSTSEHAFNILIEFIHLLGYLTDSSNLPTSIYDNVKIGAKNIIKDELRANLVLTILSTAGDTTVEDFGSLFIITKPSFIKLLIDIYLNTESSNQILKIITKLVKYNKENAVKCHECGIDLMMIDYLNKDKFSVYPCNAFAQALDLINAISVIASSTPIVSGFVSLFCPNSSQYVSSYQALFIDRMIMIIKDNSATDHLSFKEVLFRFCKPTIILPLFAQLDLQFIGGTPLPLYCEAITCLLSSILLSLPSCEVSFLESKGFQIVSYLLLNSEPRHLTLSLYDNYEAMYNKLKNADLKTVLAEYILSNLWLWTRSPEKKSILVSMTKFLRKTNQTFLSFRELIIQTNLLLYYNNPIKKVNIITESPTSADIRAEFVQFIISQIKATNTNDVVQVLVSHCLIVQDPLLVNDMLYILEKYIESETRDFTVNEVREIMNLHQLVSLNNTDIMLSLIMFMARIHRMKNIGFTSNVHIIIIMSLLPIPLMTQEFIDNLIDKTELYPEFVCLIFFISIKNKLSYTKIFAKKPKIVEGAYGGWALWPCLAAAIGGLDRAPPILDFLVACFDKQDFTILFHTLCSACEIIGVEPDPFLRHLLEKQVLYLLNCKDIDLSTKLFDFAVCQIFFRKKPVSNQMSRVFSNSDYDLMDYLDESKPLKIEIPSLQQILAVLDNISRREDKYIFGINLNEDNNWEDMNIPVILNELRVTSNSVMRSRALAIGFAFAMQTDMGDSAKRMLLNAASKGLISSAIDLSYDEVSNKLKLSTSSQLQDFVSEYQPLVAQFDKLYKTNATRIIDFIKGAETVNDLFFNAFDLNLVVKATKDIDSSIETFESKMHECRKSWFRTWNTLTFDKAPWVSAVPVVEKHWKRDMNLLGVNYPCKMKLNKNFDDHKLASFSRDSGSNATGAQLYENYKLERLSKSDDEKTLSELLMNANVEKELINVNADDDNAALIELNGEMITIKKTLKIKFKLTKDHIYIILPEKRILCRAVDTKYILFRMILHKPNGIEIFMRTGKTYLLSLIITDSLSLLKQISKIGAWSSVTVQTAPQMQFWQSQKITESWLNGGRSNFSYLLALNIFSGRSFNDLSMYPVFPWVIKDYKSEELNLSVEETFRDLSKPMGTMSEKRLKNLEDQYEGLVESGHEGYLYASCYVSPLTVIHWLTRVEPYTSLHVEIQGGRFDHPQRMFLGVQLAYEQSCVNDNDYRELIPEFFSFPEFLLNSDKFDLGKTKDGKTVDDVILPNWAKNSAMKFIYLHRKALESDYVTANINNWIDLIWGVKQDGELSIEAKNKFLPAMYESAYQKATDKRSLKDIESVKLHIGQIPTKLFDKPHPQGQRAQSQLAIKSGLHIKTTAPSVIHAFFKYRENGIQSFFVSSDGSFFKLFVNSANHDSVVIPLENKFKTLGTVFSSIPSMTSFITATDNGCVIISGENANAETVIQRHIGKVNCVSADSSYIVSGGNDTAINIWKHGKSKVKSDFFSVQTFGAEIVSVDVSASFGICAAVTTDNSLFLVSTDEGEVRKIINIGKRPQVVVVTKSWGFVCVFSQAVVDSKSVGFIDVFSINGDKICESCLNFEVEAVCKFSTPKGFDYLAVVDTSGNFYVCEAFYCNFTPICRRKVSKVTSIGYVQERECICYSTIDGVFGIIPYTPDEI